jgi:hypothetical protein
MRLGCLILFILGALSSQAQVPGFVGKRFSVFVDANPSPAVFAQSPSNKLMVKLDSDNATMAETNRFAFTTRPQVTAEYQFAKRHSIGLSYSRTSYGTTKAYYPSAPSEDETDVDVVSYDRSYRYDADVVKGDALGLHLKFYYSTTVAPIGYYQTLSVYYTRYNTYENKSSSAKQFRDDYAYPVVTMQMGRQSMPVKNLLIRAGFEFGWAFVPGNFLTETSDEWNAEQYSANTAHRSTMGYYLFNLTLGVGYVLF